MTCEERCSNCAYPETCPAYHIALDDTDKITEWTGCKSFQEKQGAKHESGL